MVALPAGSRVIGFDGTMGEDEVALMFRTAAMANAEHAIISGFGVSAASGTRRATVAAGVAFVNGKYVEMASNLTLDFPAVPAGRRPVVAIQVDSASNTGSIQIVPATSAAAPTLTKTTALYQFGLAEVEYDNTSTTFNAGNFDDIRLMADTGWVPTTPSGNWSLSSVQGLVVRRRGSGAARLSGRLLREAGAPTVAAGTETTVGALRLIPSRFLPSREVNTYAVWDVGNAPGGQAWVRIDQAGFAYITPLNKGLTANSTVRFLDTTWEV